jgi:hypothetical protein
MYQSIIGLNSFAIAPPYSENQPPGKAPSGVHARIFWNPEHQTINEMPSRRAERRKWKEPEVRYSGL